VDRRWEQLALSNPELDYEISIVRICMRARPRNYAALITLDLLPEQHSQWQVRRVYLEQSNGDRGRLVAARGPLDIPLT